MGRKATVLDIYDVKEAELPKLIKGLLYEDIESQLFRWLFYCPVFSSSLV